MVLPAPRGFVRRWGALARNAPSGGPNRRESARNGGWSEVYRRLDCQGRERIGRGCPTPAPLHARPTHSMRQGCGNYGLAERQVGSCPLTAAPSGGNHRLGTVACWPDRNAYNLSRSPRALVDSGTDRDGARAEHCCKPLAYSPRRCDSRVSRAVSASWSGSPGSSGARTRASCRP